MFFTVFNKKRNKPYIALIIYTLITFYFITVNGCQTTTSERYTSENLKKQKKLEGISHIILKDGTYINAEDKTVFYYEKYHDTSNVFVFRSEDTIREVVNGKEFLKFNRIETFLPLSKVQEVYVTKTEISAGKSVLLTVGIAVGATIATLFVLLVVFLSRPHGNSCPYIYSFDGNKYIYDAEPLGGVICEGLSRTDCSRLEHLVPSDGKFKLFIRNENDEQQHLDEMKLLLINHDGNTNVSSNVKGEFFKYKTIVSPLSVTDENEKEITAFFKAKDEYRWYSDLQLTDSSKEFLKHTLKFRFKKPEGVKIALFFFNGGITQMGSGMVKSMLELRGNKIDNWYNDLNKRDAELKKLHDYILNEETYYLKINLLENGEFKVKDVIPGGGPKMDEDKVFNIPLENVSGEYVDIVLNPPPGYWKIEQVGLIFDYEKIGNEEIKILNASYGIDDQGRDITFNLNNIDRNYYDMPEVGNYCNLYFDVPDNYARKNCEIFLRTNGWYEINIDKSKPEQTNLINDLFNTPGKIINYSIKTYKQKLTELTESKNKMYNNE